MSNRRYERADEVKDPGVKSTPGVSGVDVDFKRTKREQDVLCSRMATPSPTPTPTTTGELLFQDYLDSMQYPYEFEKEFPGRRKRPDYTVTKNGVFLFDVKDFDEKLPLLGGSSYDPYP
jgi:hypothetical protein